MVREVSFEVVSKAFTGTARARIWHRGDPFPVVAKHVGVDTETERFTDTLRVPPLVVLGVWNPLDAICYIADWEDAPYFMKELCLRDTEQRYFRLGYDEQVQKQAELMEAIDSGYVRDMQIRTHLKEIATLGYIRHNMYSLKDVAQTLLGITLEKGEDGDETSDRLSFKRGVPITDSQMVYLGWDCIATDGIGEIIPEQGSEVSHTKGMCALAHTETNGMTVDMPVYNAFEKELLEKKEAARRNLLTFGFPDPEKISSEDLQEQVEKDFHDSLRSYFKSNGIYWGVEQEGLPSKARMRLLLLHLYNFSDPGDDQRLCASNIYASLTEDKTSFKKAHKDLYSSFLDGFELTAFDQSAKKRTLPMFAARLLSGLTEGKPFNQAVADAADYMDTNADLWNTVDTVGPKKFFQMHIKGVVTANPDLQLDMTKKSKELKLTKKDHWRLDDIGVKDKFLDAYVEYYHLRKYLTTYMNRDFISADGKVHPHYTNILRTGRTSCTRPNV